MWEIRFNPWSGRSLDKEMATHASILAWKVPWTEGPGRLESCGCKDPDKNEWLSKHAWTLWEKNNHILFNILLSRLIQIQHFVTLAFSLPTCIYYYYNSTKRVFPCFPPLYICMSSFWLKKTLPYNINLIIGEFDNMSIK